ncbi:MAG: low temperature requirement protein A [Microthrixaceae bacterium]
MRAHRTPDHAALELLYDLFFVATLAVLTFGYSHEPTLENLAWIATVFTLVWVIWVATTLVLNLLGKDSALIRALVIGQILLLIAAVTATDGVYSHTYATGPLFSVTLLFLAGIYWEAQRIRPDLKSFSTTRIWACVLAAAIFAFPFYTDPGYLIFWLLGLLILIAPALRPPALESLGIDTKKLAERLGIFTAIVLGESFVKTSLSAADSNLGGLVLECVLATLVIVLGIWWLYFANVPQDGEVSGRTAHRFWTIAHLPLHFGITGVAVGSTMAILPAVSYTAESQSTWTLVISVALVFVALAVLEFLANEQGSRLVGALFLSAAAVTLGFGVVSATRNYFDSQLATIFLAGLMAVTVVADYFVRTPPQLEGTK